MVSALIAAKKRGVDVAVVAEHKQNTGDSGGGRARAALNALVNAGVLVRTVDAFAAHHDKVIVSTSRPSRPAASTTARSPPSPIART